ncbi:hypothetical protein ig2599ANME_0203 [groundwater metagenome]
MKSAMSSSELLNRQLLFLFDTKTQAGHEYPYGGNMKAASSSCNIGAMKDV